MYDYLLDEKLFMFKKNKCIKYPSYTLYKTNV